MAVLAGVVTAMVCLGTGPAWSVPPGGHVRPGQVFGGLVNASTGSPAPVTIAMGCFGPIRPGQTGHPFAGQTVEVFRPEVVQGHFGFTGSAATAIGAFFGPPPPSATPVASSYVRLSHYGVAEAIPTSLTLPCGGAGQVTFVPLPMSPTSRTATVAVTFVGQP